MRKRIALTAGWSAKLLQRRLASTVLLIATFIAFTSRSMQTCALAQATKTAESRSAARDEEQKAEQRRFFALKREAWFEQQRSYPYAHIPAGAYWRAQMEKHALIERRNQTLVLARPDAAKPLDAFSGVTWTPDGPAPVYSTAIYSNPPSGRATSIAIDPANPNTIYLGTAAGGVWKTTDGGQNWIPLTDSQASLAIGAVAVDPNNSNNVYAGTGEPDYSSDSYYGEGLLKSTDGGTTWTLIRTPFTTSDTAPEFTSIAVQPGNSNIVLAANTNSFGTAGLFRSTDGGQTWSHVVSTGGYSGVTAVMFDVQNPSIAYAGVGGIQATAPGTVLMSRDAGQTWTSISGSGTSALPAPSAVLRTALAESSDGKTLFAACAKSDFSAPGAIYSTTDGGTSWTQLSVPNTTVLDWYTNAIAVSPANPSVLYITGTAIYQSLDGGQTWAAIISGVYSDQHGFAFSPDGSKFYVADDGGIYVTSAPAVANPTFVGLNQTLNTLTFYPGFSLLPGQANSLLAGSQDHGLNLYTGTLASWESGDSFEFCGDGGSAYIDPQGKYAYAHCWGGSANWIANSTGESNPASWQSAASGIGSSDRVPWVVDIKGDQQNVANVYTATNFIYQSTDYAGSWTAISPDLTAGKSTVNTIGISPSDSNTIYTGAGDGTLSVTTNALAGTGATWKTLSGLPSRPISKIAVQPDSPSDVYVTVGGFGTGHVFHSTNGGASWTDISGDLPNTVVNSILVDPDLLNTLYVATDIGVFASSNGGTNWTPLGQGLPNVVVFDILMYEPTHTVRVISHGRGAWDAVVPMVGLQSSPTSLSFANQTQGTTSTAQIITLTNNLTSTSLGLTGFQMSGPFTQTNDCGATLAPGATCSVDVAFAPTTAGIVYGSLTISSSSNSATVSLSGTGLGIPQATFDSTSLSFANQPLGVPSGVQTVHLTNSGDASLTGIAISVGGTNSVEFSQTNTCGSTIVAGSSCTVSVTFTPNAIGAQSATVSIADSALGSPQSVALGGVGEAPFSFSATATSSTVQAGTAASYQLTLTAAQNSPLANAVTFTCSGLPAFSSCSFSPVSVSSGSSLQNVTLAISTMPNSQPSRAIVDGSRSIGFVALSVLAVIFLPRRKLLTRLMALVILVFSVIGCSGGGSGSTSGNNSQGTPTGNYKVIVTAAQSGIYQTTQTLSLIVQ